MTDHVKNKFTKVETAFKIQKRALSLLAMNGQHQDIGCECFSIVSLERDGLLIQLAVQKLIVMDILEHLFFKPQKADLYPFFLDIWTPKKKVFSLQWDLQNGNKLARFNRGLWENQLHELYDLSQKHNQNSEPVLFFSAFTSLVEHSGSITHH